MKNTQTNIDEKGPNPIEKIQNKLLKMGIKTQPDMEHLSSALDKAKTTGEDIADLIVVRGKSPVMPRDGKVEWTKGYFAKGYHVDSKTKRMDFHEKSAVPAVEKGELLVKASQAQPGRDGLNVYGAPIKVPQPKRIDLRAGPNVSWDAEASGYRADCPGRVELKGAILGVQSVYHVHGDVGTSTGNIKHNGDVIINGNVVSEFKVEATGSIEIKGAVDACDITCGGALVITKGINEVHSKKICVKGDIHSKYINSASIECEGDIYVESEIIQSIIQTTGMVECKGRVTGGKIMAAKGITVGEAGSRSDVQTTLIAGIDQQALQAMKASLLEIKKLTNMLQKLEGKLRHLEMCKKVLDPYPGNKKRN
jgi:uncharacterized protein (DUF342 family)